MGTREVYEEKLRSGTHLRRDPTINPGLGSARCPYCLSLLNPTTNSVPLDPSSSIRSAVNVLWMRNLMFLVFGTGIPFVQKHVKGPKWLHLLIGEVDRDFRCNRKELFVQGGTGNGLSKVTKDISYSCQFYES
ncbi:hypothetical protein D1007_41390 [Hordeum vulgare]|nr:hypothetical protein D1007_41390 [Hordeum vulgare]